MVDVVLFAGLVLLGGIILVIYTWLVEPKQIEKGYYSNPKIGRRKITMVICPDGQGLLREIIEEVGTKHANYDTLVLDANGQRFIIPHVNFERDCVAFNKKQAFAGGNHPVLLCCVDREGIRHPEFLDALHAGKRSIEETSKEKELNRLRLAYASMKKRVREMGSDDEIFNKFEDVSDRLARIKKNMNRFEGSHFDKDEEELKR